MHMLCQWLTYLNFFIFNWRIFILQCFFSFLHTSLSLDQPVLCIVMPVLISPIPTLHPVQFVWAYRAWLSVAILLAAHGTSFDSVPTFVCVFSSLYVSDRIFFINIFSFENINSFINFKFPVILTIDVVFSLFPLSFLRPTDDRLGHHYIKYFELPTLQSVWVLSCAQIHETGLGGHVHHCSCWPGLMPLTCQWADSSSEIFWKTLFSIWKQLGKGKRKVKWKHWLQKLVSILVSN